MAPSPACGGRLGWGRGVGECHRWRSVGRIGYQSLVAFAECVACRLRRAPTLTLPRKRGRGYFSYTASDNEVKVKSRSFIGGINITNEDSSPDTRTGLPSSSMLLSMITGDSLKRKFFTGYLISPFSM